MSWTSKAQSFVVLLVCLLTLFAVVSSGQRRALNTAGFVLTLKPNGTGQYALNESVEVNIISDQAGVLENSFGNSSLPIEAAVRAYNIGNISGPGFYVLSFSSNGRAFVNKGLLVIPATGGKFSVEVLPETLNGQTTAAAATPAFRKFLSKITGARLVSAWNSSLSSWIAQNIANVGRAAIGCVVFGVGSGGAAILLSCVVPSVGIMGDAFATVLVRLAQDLKTSGQLTSEEFTAVKRVIDAGGAGLQFVSSIISDDRMGKVINTAQSVAQVVLSENENAQVIAKTVGDATTKYTFILQFKNR